MKIAVAAESDKAEPRVAGTPETVKKLIGLGAAVAVEPGAGLQSGIPDADYAAAGATVAAGAAKDADIVLKVRRPSADDLKGYKKGALVIAIMDPYGNEAALKRKGCGPGSSSERTRTAITGALKKKLKDLMGEFQDLRWVLRAGVVGAACLVADGLVAGAVGA